MAYQVLARKWRPQRFEDVLGQQAVTRTLKNALKSKRIAQAFVFSGPRGCGKTTTARILARALSCVKGPTPEPCGVCDACIEIAEGRDIDVLEIDAATHTGVDNVREVIIEGLSIAPVRNRYKVFIIDEVHMLSALVVQRAAQVDRRAAAARHLHDGDDRAAQDSRHGAVALAGLRVQDHLRRRSSPSGCGRSPAEEQIEIPDEGLMLLARAGEGSMRDSLSAFDQVRAFAGDTIAVDDVVTVLGLVGRDLVFDMLEAVVAEDAPAAFALVERAIERGYDLRLLCRELARATRDLLILSVDPKRASDPDVAGDAERERLSAMAGQWSREDLLRAFDLLTKAEQEVRVSDQPRYNLEMALLRLMHLRKLVPLTELLSGGRKGSSVPKVPQVPKAPVPKVGSKRAYGAQVGRTGTPLGTAAKNAASGTPGTSGTPGRSAGDADGFKDRFLAEIKVRQSRRSITWWWRRPIRIDATAVGHHVYASSRTRRTRRASATSRRRGCSRSPRRSPAGRCPSRSSSPMPARAARAAAAGSRASPPAPAQRARRRSHRPTT